MKKSLLTITFVLLFSTSFFQVNAEEWYIETLLDLNYWIEEYDLELEQIDYVYFSNSTTRQIFQNFEIANTLLKNEIINKYRSEEFDYYQTKAIIKSQKMFVYHVNRLSYYLSVKEQNPSFVDTDTFILKHYSNARLFYKKVRHYVNN